MSTEPIYWEGQVRIRDDFGDVIADTFIDGKTKNGPWGIMTLANWDIYGVGKLGTGCGQRYEWQLGGKWLKVEG
jgi:hypothetical protein